MLRLGKGIKLVVDAAATPPLRLGEPARLGLSEVPIRLWVTLEGEPDTQTGLLINVREIKQAVAALLAEAPPATPDAAGIIAWAWQGLARKFPQFQLVRVALALTEALEIARTQEWPDMIQLTTKYELAAAHRLSCPDWSGEQNVAAFGPCSNPRGHGHNYTVEVTLRGRPDPHTGQLLDLETVRATVQRWIIERFDHKNLNEDVSEFAELMPTVENMALVFWDLLIDKFEAAFLHRVAVWETPTTVAEYFGPAAGLLRHTNLV